VRFITLKYKSNLSNQRELAVNHGVKYPHTSAVAAKVLIPSSQQLKMRRL